MWWGWLESELQVQKAGNRGRAHDKLSFKSFTYIRHKPQNVGAKRCSLTGSTRHPLAVALNKSPACVLSGNESTIEEGSSPLLLTDFLRPSFMSIIFDWDDCEQDAGDPLMELSLSTLFDGPVWCSDFCMTSQLKLNYQHGIFNASLSNYGICSPKRSILLICWPAHGAHPDEH